MEKSLKAVLSNRIYLSRTDDLELRLMEELTYKFPGPSQNSRPITVCNVSRVNDNLLSIPIGRTDLIPKNYEIIDKRVYNKVNIGKSNITLRDSQQEIYELLDDNWVINAKPGWGKTYTALSIAKKLGQKTIVVVQTVKLRNQWAVDCENIFNLKPGIIGSGKLQTKQPIVIANVQTLRKHITKLSSLFGLVIVDEVHRLPADNFKLIIDKARARYKIGLSGTLGRKDGKHALIPDYIGHNVYKPPKENVIDPIVLVYESKYGLSSNNMIPWANKVNALAYNPGYQKEIVNIVNAQMERGHKVLILSDRIEFLEKCNEMTEDSECIISKTKNQEEIESKLKSGIIKSIYGSISIFKEGISINELSCVILASPTNNEYLLEQIIGRIMRICEGKMKPEVIDILLKGKTGENQFKTRKGFYAKEGFKVITIPLELIV